MKKKIYVASSWRNAHQPKVVKLLRAIGHEVYDFRNPSPQTGFDWAEIDVKWQHWTPEEYVTALKHPRAEQAFNSDFDAMKWADTCVMVLPCGRSANTEAGWMKGAGKSVYVYQPVMQEPELMYKIYDGIFVHEYELVDHFVHLEKQEEVQNDMIANKYMVSNADGSTGWILINKGTDSTAFVDRWGLETRDRAEVCEWCTANNIAFTFEDMVFNSNTTLYLH